MHTPNPASPSSSSSRFVVMGVCGSGKSTLGKALADRTEGKFIEGDDYHSPFNRQKMASGQPLNDQDRAGWLDTIAQQIAEHCPNDGPLFVACSALKLAYRDRLRLASPELQWIYLHGTRDLLLQRMNLREDHFMPTDLLDSQLATLQPPINEGELRIDIAAPLERQVKDVCCAFKLV